MMDEYLLKHGLGEDLVMQMGGQPMGETLGEREMKHVVILHRMYNLGKSISALEHFISEMQTGGPPPPNPTTDTKDAMPSLTEFLVSMPGAVDCYIERLESILESLRSDLF